VLFESWPSLVAFAEAKARPSNCPASSPALTSCGVRESWRSFPKSRNPSALLPVAFQVLSNLSHGIGSCGHCRWQRRLFGQEVGSGVFRSVAWSGEVMAVVGVVRPNPGVSTLSFSYSWAMQPRSAVQPNPPLNGRPNGVPPSLGHSRLLAHFLWPRLGVTPLASPLAIR
jgi:hypothetical protein